MATSEKKKQLKRLHAYLSAQVPVNHLDDNGRQKAASIANKWHIGNACLQQESNVVLKDYLSRDEGTVHHSSSLCSYLVSTD